MLQSRTASLLLVGLVLGICLTQTATAQELTREIVINIPEFTLYLYENGIVIKKYPIGVGTEIKPSILGETEVINRVENPTYYPIRWWERGLEPIPPGPDNPVGTRWIGLGIPSYGIHGTNNPASIGQAMSSGCIRMYNHDVEELMDLIRIGTKVTLIYQTVTLNQDPLLNTKMVTIYPDIYKNNSNSLEQVKPMLEQRAWTDVHLEVLAAMLESPTGVPQPLPLAVDFLVNGSPMEAAAVRYGNRYYIPLGDLFTESAGSKFKDRQDWDQEYVNVFEFADKLGYGCLIEDCIELFSVELMLFEESTGVQGFLRGNQLYIPVEELSQALGLPIPSSLAAYTEEFNGVKYLSQEESLEWGIALSWSFPQRQAEIALPLAYLDDQPLGPAVVHDEEVYFPIDRIQDLIAVPDEELSSHYGVEVVQAGDKLYVPEWVIQWLLPGAEITVVYP